MERLLEMTLTYQTRLLLNEEQETILQEYARIGVRELGSELGSGKAPIKTGKE